jgi:hypothetical protein
VRLPYPDDIADAWLIVYGLRHPAPPSPVASSLPPPVHAPIGAWVLWGGASIDFPSAPLQWFPLESFATTEQCVEKRRVLVRKTVTNLGPAGYQAVAIGDTAVQATSTMQPPGSTRGPAVWRMEWKCLVKTAD